MILVIRLKEFFYLILYDWKMKNHKQNIGLTTVARMQYENNQIKWWTMNTVIYIKSFYFSFLSVYTSTKIEIYILKNYAYHKELSTVSIIFCLVLGWFLKISQKIEQQRLFTQKYT